MIDPEHSRQHGAEGQHGTHAPCDVVIGDQHVVPVVQTQVGQLVEEPVDGRPQHQTGEGGGAETRDQRTAFRASDESIEGVDQPDPGKTEKEGGHRLEAESRQAEETAQPRHAQGYRPHANPRTARSRAVLPQRPPGPVDEFCRCGQPQQVGDVELGQQAETEQLGVVRITDGEIDEAVEGVEGGVCRETDKS